MIYKTLNKFINKEMVQDHQELIIQFVILVDLIITSNCAKITMIQVIVYLEIVVSIFMIDLIIRLDGSWKKNFNRINDKDGKGLIILIIRRRVRQFRMLKS